MVNIVKSQEAATEVITHDVTPLTVDTDAGSYAKVGWAIVVIGFLGFLIWATFAPLDKGVPMSGTVVKESNRKSVQYLQNGIVQDILVQDGDVVKAGQVLVRMNNVQVKSALDITEVQFVSARATEARLLAELAGQSSVTLPASLKVYKDQPAVTEAMTLQNQLLQARQGSLRSELSAADENIEGLKLQITGLQQSRDNKKDQLGSLKEQLDNSRELSKEGYLARNRLLELERTYSQTNGAISEDVGNIGRAQRQISELQARKSQRLQDYQKEVRTLLADTQKEAEALEGRLDAQKFDVANVEVKSPVDGIVVGSNIFTRGGVVAAGAKMMEIVPSEDALVVEGQLPVNLIDKVRVGMPAELIFSAFNSNRTPHIPGTVIQVSADRSVEERSGQPYYKVRARVSPEGAKLIAEKKLDIQPGMPAEMFVKTGERTMMNYLLKPVFDRAKSSMSED
ncbi:HlyD family type I secretion periplasmic adaptor subunit [Duganella dendranthematis]|jgi:protease secretion system membrane fusion protein|uniref:Membrane fusion protein (MFP) family protein n=1 Tax=Duganella dendranthematis TaxID=2728021 RepID=A0ABX6M5W2_9BURK|nr:HlyD family type I secretion periplasmic adaptor subunit [Duganella dendranthematis]QJD89679.1 HlyD family type I secretion periplasmic adaptor subunit [Duganella dendranthematis]